MNVQKIMRSIVHAGALTLACLVSPMVQANVVTDWNAVFESSLTVPAERGPRVPFRTLAIMHLAMFDAVNGIDTKYKSYATTAGAPPGARAEAAAIQAAYTVLSTLLPAHKSAYDAALQTSLAALPGSSGNSQSIARGREWGESVAKAIIAARSSDGATTVLPPFVGETTAGFWRHAPLGASPTAGYANRVTVPMLLPDPVAFDPGPPYGNGSRALALASSLYAQDVNELKARGGAVSAIRTSAELDEALFLDACDIAALNGVLRAKVSPNARLVDTAREFALLNIVGFDATVVFFRLKYHHALWRPFQAINFANEDGNDATVADPTWVSKLPTPPHPEYISAHVTLFTSMLQVIARLEGDADQVEVNAAASAFYPGGTKTYESLAAISDACIEARVNVGFHFRQTCETSQVVGRAIGNYVVENGLLAVSHP